MRLSDLPLDFSGILSNAMWVGQGKIYFDYKEEVKQNTGGYAYECLCPNLAYSKVMVKVPGEQKALLYGKADPCYVRRIIRKGIPKF